MREMVEGAINHASIMAWGFFNEGPSDQETACHAYQSNAELIKSLDDSRFVTWADDKGERSVCLHHATLISFNKYPAWYDDLYNLTAPGDYWSSRAAWVRTHFPQVPFLISETGAGGIYEWSHNTTAAQWTTAYQTQVIVQDVDVALSDSSISGLSLWHYFDFETMLRRQEVHAATSRDRCPLSVDIST